MIDIIIILVLLAGGGGLALGLWYLRKARAKERALAGSHPRAGVEPGDSLGTIAAKNAAFDLATDAVGVLERLLIQDEILPQFSREQDRTEAQAVVARFHRRG